MGIEESPKRKSKKAKARARRDRAWARRSGLVSTRYTDPKPYIATLIEAEQRAHDAGDMERVRRIQLEIDRLTGAGPSKP